MRVYDKYYSIVMAEFYIITFGIELYVLLKVLYQPSGVYSNSFLIPTVMALLCDIAFQVLIFGTGMPRRGMLRFRVDKDGICFYGLTWKTWKIRWDEICFYGIKWSNYNPNQLSSKRYGSFVISRNPNDYYCKDTYAFLKCSKDKMMLQATPELYAYLDAFIPKDMKKQITWSYDTHRDIYIHRNPKRIQQSAARDESATRA